MTEDYDCINDYIGKETYFYNAWGQLVNYNNDVGETASYTYYSDELRASKTIGDNTTKYYYDGDNVINETLNNNSYATNVMGVNGYVSRRQNGTTGYLFKDAHGDVLSIYTSTSNKAADYTYDAWGEIRTKNESSSFENNPLRYYGQYYDYESGMTYLRARYYDSSIRRFITEDPAKDGLNWYAYCDNNPVMPFDPSGTSPDDEYLDSTDFYEVANDITTILSCQVRYSTSTNKDYLHQKANEARQNLKEYVKKQFSDNSVTSDFVNFICDVLDDGTQKSVEENSSILCVVAYCMNELTSRGMYGKSMNLTYGKLYNVYAEATSSGWLYLFPSTANYIAENRENIMKQYLGDDYSVRPDDTYTKDGKYVKGAFMFLFDSEEVNYYEQ